MTTYVQVTPEAVERNRKISAELLTLKKLHLKDAADNVAKFERRLTCPHERVVDKGCAIMCQLECLDCGESWFD